MKRTGVLGSSFGTYFLFAIYVVCIGVMVSDYKPISNLVGSATTIITLLYICINKNYHNSPFEKKNIHYVLFFLVYFTITSLPQFEPYPWFTSIMVYIMVFTPFFLFMYLKHTRNVKLMKFLVFSFIIIWNYFLVLCFITCLTIPDLARLMAANRPAFVDMINGGGYPMGYGSAVLATFLFSQLIFGKFQRIVTKVFVIADIVFMIMTVLVINSFITLASLLAGMFIAVIYRLTKTSRARVISYFITGCVMLLVYINLSSILLFLTNNVKDDFWNRRLTEVYEAVALDSKTSHVETREHVYEISKEGIKRSPIIGNGYKFGNIFQKEESNGVGNHSSFLDTIAQFGLIGGLPILLFMFYPYRKTRRENENWYHLVPLYIMLCLNPILRCYHVMLIVFLIIPSIQFINRYSKQVLLDRSRI